MNTKKLLVCLAVLGVLFCSAQSLTFSGNQHRSQNHMAKVYAHQVAQKVMSYHLETKDIDIPNQVVEELKTFLMGDKQIMDSFMNNKPLSQGASKRLQTFFVNNKGFNDAMIKEYDENPSFPKCYKDLKSEQKRKFVGIIINQIDFSKIFNDNDYQVTADDVKKILDSVSADKQLGPKVTQCLQNQNQLPSRA